MKLARRYDGGFSRSLLPPDEENFRVAPAAIAIISDGEETFWARD